MTVGLAIPGVPVVHPREAWQEPGWRMELDFNRKPPAYIPGNVRLGAIHYSAALNLPDGDIGEFEYQIPPWLRASQRDYLRNRDRGGYTRVSDGTYFPGYPLGYNFAVDWLGGAWEIRGFDFMDAATSGHNGYVIAVIMVTDRHDPASMLAWRTARAILREAKRRSGRSDFANRPWGHGEFKLNTGVGTATACPGAPNLAQIHDGLADLDFDEGDPPMGTLTAIRPAPPRAYDSRPGQPVDPPYDRENKNVVRAPMQPGERREIFIGLAQQAAIQITVVGHGKPGFIAVSSDGVLPRSSVVNYDQADIVEGNGTIVALTGGKCWLHCEGAPTDVIVDVTAQG